MTKKTDDIYKNVKNKIYSGYYWPREQLIESALSDEMGVSRTVIRDVLRRLSVDGLVTILPHKGTFVAGLSYQSLKETLEIEAILEGSAAYLATSHLNVDQIDELHLLLAKSKEIDPADIQSWANYNWCFHKIIIGTCGNEQLIQMIKDNVQFVKFWFVQLSLPAEIAHRNAGHEEIWKALKKRNAALVRELMEKHILFAVEDLIERIQNLNPSTVRSKSNRSNLLYNYCKDGTSPPQKLVPHDQSDPSNTATKEVLNDYKGIYR